MAFFREKCTICTKNFLVLYWSGGYKMNLEAFTWVSTWQALDTMLMTSKSLFQPTPPSWALDYISNCLLDITLISLRHLKLNLSKAVLIILQSQTRCCFCIFDFAERQNYHSDVQTRHWGNVLKISFSIHMSSIITSFRVYHSSSWAVFQKISLRTPIQACSSIPFHFDYSLRHIQLSLCSGKMISVVTEVVLHFSQKKTWEYKSRQDKKKNASFLQSPYYKF